MDKYMKKIIILSYILLLIHAVIANPKWEFIFEKDDIKVYSREATGSAFHDFKGVTTINNDLWNLLALMQDISAQREWIPRCKVAHLMKKINILERIIYYRIDVPWPFSDRDIITKSLVKVSPKNDIVEILVNSINNVSMAAQKDVVRVNNFRLQFIIIPVSGKKTRIILNISMDPGGALPSALSNLANRYLPYYFLFDMRKLLTRKNYKNEAKKIKDKLIELKK